MMPVHQAVTSTWPLASRATFVSQSANWLNWRGTCRNVGRRIRERVSSYTRRMSMNSSGREGRAVRRQKSIVSLESPCTKSAEGWCCNVAWTNVSPSTRALTSAVLFVGASAPYQRPTEALSAPRVSHTTYPPVPSRCCEPPSKYNWVPQSTPCSAEACSGRLSITSRCTITGFWTASPVFLSLAGGRGSTKLSRDTQS